MRVLYVKFHGWRGFSLTNIEPDMFDRVFRVGFATVYLGRRCLLDAYRKLRATIGDALDMVEGR